MSVLEVGATPARAPRPRSPDRWTLTPALFDSWTEQRDAATPSGQLEQSDKTPGDRWEWVE
ncbi:hypothetical protein [Actinoplanes rectilineatus]|uniref:hypothetical protein n=1 Tax=Actinoplanes rectilineatus TaxID=113571 RepID=UPI0005F289EF|nr:hypothetical protein [Actinoplanes rectilineatus]